MKTTLLALLLIAPAWLFGQSLAEVAKKEKDRRGKNKQEGRQVHVISESDLESAREGSSGESTDEDSTAGAASPAPPRSYGGIPPSSPGASDEEIDEGEEEEDYAPDFIPPDSPLPEKLEMFEAMKRRYQRDVREIDKSIAENEKKIQDVQGELAAASALGGAGLPVAPTTGTGTANRQMTGQESASLAAELNRLEQMNDELRQRKEGLRLDLQAKGRAAGIPPGYLRF